MPRGQLRGDIDQDVIRLYLGGASTTEISRQFSVCVNTVINVLKQHSVLRRNKKIATAMSWTKEKRDAYSERMEGNAYCKDKKWKYKTPPERDWMKGSSNHFWKGGITPLYKAMRNLAVYQEWRFSCLVRDNFTCVICGKSRASGASSLKADLNVDHIYPFAKIIQDCGI